MVFDKIRKWARKNIKIIMAVDAVLIIALTAYIVGIDEPAEAENLTVVNCTYDSAEISWSPAEDAKMYRIYKSKDGADYEYLSSTGDTHFTDRNVRTGETYYYTVTSTNGLKSTDIETDNSVVAVPQLSKPDLQIDTSKGEMQLNISAVDGASGYEITRDGEVIGQSEETSFVDKDVEGGQHEYSVKAYRYKNNTVFSECSDNVAVDFKVIGNLNVDTFNNDLVIDWDDSDYYNEFKVFNGDETVSETSSSECTIPGYALDTVYDIKVVGYNTEEKAQSPEEEKKFEIIQEPMTTQDAIDAAVEWGIKIANDDSFTYGTGKRSHRYGCYFCQTNVGPRMNKKGKSKVNGHSYEKTYCCNPFVHACYAHGAEDPAMLAACQKGSGIAMTKKSFTRYGCWKSVGKVSRGNLQKGDVLVRSNHVMMYIGDGQIVHAAGGGWDAGSIRVCDLGGRKYSFVMRYTGTGKGTKDVIYDVDAEGNVVDAEGNIIKKAEKKEAPKENPAEADKTEAKTEEEKTKESEEKKADEKPADEKPAENASNGA